MSFLVCRPAARTASTLIAERSLWRGKKYLEPLRSFFPCRIRHNVGWHCWESSPVFLSKRPDLCVRQGG